MLSLSKLYELNLLKLLLVKMMVETEIPVMRCFGDEFTNLGEECACQGGVVV